MRYDHSCGQRKVAMTTVSPTDRTGELINYSVFSGSRADGPLDRALDGRDSRTRSG